VTEESGHPAEDDEEEGRLRRCIVSGERRDPAEMVRFVVGPEDRLVPDLASKLPGRGIWVGARRELLARAVAKQMFARAARRSVKVDPDLPSRVEALAERQCLDLLGLARRAGAAAAGFEKVEAMLRGGGAGVLIGAADGAADGQDKLRRLAPGVPHVAVLPGAAMAAALGRQGAVAHAAIAPGKLAERFIAASDRLAGVRGAA
jgi:predicted RNA-binding protein YlxR (DUF448 family)